MSALIFEEYKVVDICQTNEPIKKKLLGILFNLSQALVVYGFMDMVFGPIWFKLLGTKESQNVH